MDGGNIIFNKVTKVLLEICTRENDIEIQADLIVRYSFVED